MLFLFSCIELRLIIGHNLHHSSKALRSRTQYDIVVKPSLIKRMQICKSTSFFSPPQTWWDLSKVFWDTQELKGFSGFCLFCYWVFPLQLSTLLENLQASRKLTDAETYACTSLTSHCQQVLPEFLHITAALILSLSSCSPPKFWIPLLSLIICTFSNQYSRRLWSRNALGAFSWKPLHFNGDNWLYPRQLHRLCDLTHW